MISANTLPHRLGRGDGIARDAASQRHIEVGIEEGHGIDIGPLDVDLKVDLHESDTHIVAAVSQRFQEPLYGRNIVREKRHVDVLPGLKAGASRRFW